VDEKLGCEKRFRCPYHAWTYTPAGNLSSVPHGEQSFPALEKSEMGLKEIPSVEKYGFVWVMPAGGGEVRLDDYLCSLGADLTWLQLADLVEFKRTTKVWNCHWKLIADGGLESYHFRFAHRDTIAPYFFDNLSTYDQFGYHARTVLPRSSLSQLKQEPESSWALREHTHLVYALFPMTTFLAQHKHVDWVHAMPLSPEKTEITVMSLVPKPNDGHEWSKEERELWQFNHDITNTTLDEDFSMAESIQKGLKSGVNSEFIFGRNEGALNQLHCNIEEIMSE
jgi:phenylpropionate dioxygenase-like ring-hydroxylating dioxygenase large terminal subunit